MGRVIFSNGDWLELAKSEYRKLYMLVEPNGDEYLMMYAISWNEYVDTVIRHSSFQTHLVERQAARVMEINITMNKVVTDVISRSGLDEIKLDGRFKDNINTMVNGFCTISNPGIGYYPVTVLGNIIVYEKI